MKFGLRPAEGGTDFERTVAQVEAAERLGYDSVWLAEHFTDDDHWWPSSLVNLAAFAARTDRIQVGTNILVTPFYDPVWLAGSTAMLDVISEGRFVCGLGVGYDPREFDALGVPREERVGRTIETISLLDRLWSRDPVTYDGRYFELEAFAISPTPVQRPRPPVWLGVWGDYLLEQAATRADAWFPGAVADLDQLAERNATYTAHLDSEPGARPLLRDVVVADSRRVALRRAERYLAPKYEVYADRGHQFFTDYSETSFEEFVADRAVVGTPDECIDQLHRFVDELDVDHLVVRFCYDGMADEVVDATMETIATDVIPSFEN